MADTTERRTAMRTIENEMKNLSVNINKAIDRMDKMNDQVVQNQVQINGLIVGLSGNAESIKSVCKDIDELTTRVNTLFGINSFSAIIAGILGVFYK